MSIHKRIRERRLAMGLTSHGALADLVGVSWQTVQLWEKEGGTAPNRNRIDKVAKALGVTKEWLLGGEDDVTMERLTPDEAELLADYRLASARAKIAIKMAAKTSERDKDAETAPMDAPAKSHKK